MSTEWDKEYFTKNVNKIIEVAEGVVSNDADVLEGCVEIVKCYRQFPEEKQNEYEFLFLGMIGVESQIDHLPMRKSKNGWNKDALSEKEKEYQECVKTFSGQIIEDSKKIIKSLKNAPQD